MSETMRGAMEEQIGRTGEEASGRIGKAAGMLTGLPTHLRLAALLTLALGLAGCGSSSTLFSKSPLDVFSTSSKAVTDKPAGSDPAASEPDIDCPTVSVRNGAATLMIGSKPGEGEPSALDLRYQGSIVRTARECHVSAGIMTMKVGVEGRIVTGPAGGPGDVDVPLRLAVVREGVNPQTIVSKLAHIPVTIGADVDRATFTDIDPDISFPLPARLGDLDAYVVYVGFDPGPQQPEKKPAAKKGRPAVKRKPRAAPVAKLKPRTSPKTAPQTAGQPAATQQTDGAWPAPKPQTDSAWPAATPKANDNVWPASPPPRQQ